MGDDGAKERAWQRELVRRGYDQISWAYRTDDGLPGPSSAEDTSRYAGWAAELAVVPAASLVQADVADLQLRSASLDAVVSFYALIHVPLADQRSLLRRVRAWLRPGGYLLAIVGAGRWTGTEEYYGAPMFWDHEMPAPAGLPALTGPPARGQAGVRTTLSRGAGQPRCARGTSG